MRCSCSSSRLALTSLQLAPWTALTEVFCPRASCRPFDSSSGLSRAHHLVSLLCAPSQLLLSRPPSRRLAVAAFDLDRPWCARRGALGSVASAVRHGAHLARRIRSVRAALALPVSNMICSAGHNGPAPLAEDARGRCASTFFERSARVQRAAPSVGRAAPRDLRRCVRPAEVAPRDGALRAGASFGMGSAVRAMRNCV